LGKSGPTAKDIIQNLRKSLSDKDRLLEESRLEATEALAKMRCMEIEGDDLRQQLSGQDSLKDVIRKLENEKKMWEKQEMEMKGALSKMRRTIADLKAQIQVLMENDNKETPGGSSIASDSAPMEELKSQNDELRDDLNQMIQRVLDLNGRIEGQKEEMNTLRQKTKEVELPLRSELANLRAEYEQLKERFAEKEEELRIKDSRIDELVSELDVLKDQVDYEPSASESEVDFPTISLDRCDSIYANVEEAIQSSEKVAAEFLKTSWNKLCGADRRYKQAVWELFQKIDTEGDGLIDLCEFTVAVFEYGLTDQEAINNVFNKVCSGTFQQQKVMELADLEPYFCRG